MGTRSGRLALAVPALVLLSGCAAVRTAIDPQPDALVPDRFPRNASRFPLRPLTDSTAAFTPAEVGWVRIGATGIAVDPAQGDALVARLRVVELSGEEAVVLVTGQTTRLAQGQVLLLVAPTPRWWQAPLFWRGAAAGAGLVGLSALLLLLL
jgi:hypothetical protein